MKNSEPPEILRKTLALAESWQNCTNTLRSKEQGFDLYVSLGIAELERNLVIDPENLVD